MKCCISTEDLDRNSLVKKAKESLDLVGRDLASEVSTTKRYTWPGDFVNEQPFSQIEANGRRAFNWPNPPKLTSADHYRVAVLDCGIKLNQMRLLAQHGCTLEVFPITSTAGEILASKPDGLFISNGPGDPAAVPHVVSQIRTLVESGLPTFGICFGHQLLGIALGGKTYKLKFGHRGGNQAVKDLTTGKAEITSQNHGFCVDKDSLDPALVETTHINLNDGTSEGLRHKELPVFSVQYHPEACPGPHDSVYLFSRFIDLMKRTAR